MSAVGRPKGTPKTGGREAGTPNKATADVRALAQEHGSWAIGELVRLAKTSGLDTARIAALKELLDRGYGRSVQGIATDPQQPMLIRFEWAKASEPSAANGAGRGQKQMVWSDGSSMEEPPN
jgi:hypothetical protein